MRFAKYQGTGNDFVMLADPDDRLELTADLVRALCDRRFGIGGDGVIRVAPGDGDADLFMDYVNSDGSIGEMCGNGIRCLALFARAEGLTSGKELSVGTRSGVKTVVITDDGLVRADMGAPVFVPAEVPVKWEGEDALHAKVELEDAVIEVACVSMGNPHSVIFVDDPAVAPVTTLGPILERHEAFPNHTNVEFARVVSPHRVEMRVWERGSGETFACGTGACAVAVVARLLHGTSEQAVIAQPGGEVEVEWKGSLDQRAPVFMTGPASKSFDGEVRVEDLIAR